MEDEFVKDAYNKIANDFDRTRYNHWPSVTRFIESLDSGSLVLDAGCGNGKNMQIRNDLKYIGCDTSDKLLEICQKKGFEVCNANIKELPFLNETFDHIMCIAVLHHISTPGERLSAVMELLRVLKPGGKLALQVWALEQNLTPRFIPIETEYKNDFFVTWKHTDELIKRYYHLFDESEIDQLISKLKGKLEISVVKTFEKCNWCLVLTKN